MRRGLSAHAARLGPLSLGHLGRQDERVQSWRRLLAAYDVDRQLERGYSLTLTADGQLVRSAAGTDRGAGDRDPVRRRDGAQPREAVRPADHEARSTAGTRDEAGGNG